MAIFGDLQPLWSSLLTKPDLLRFRCFSGHVLSKTKSVTPHFFYISDIANSSSFSGKIFRKKSMLEKFRANVLKCQQSCICYKQTRTNNQGFETPTQKLLPTFTFIKSKESEISFAVPSFPFEFMTSST